MRIQKDGKGLLFYLKSMPSLRLFQLMAISQVSTKVLEVHPFKPYTSTVSYILLISLILW